MFRWRYVIDVCARNVRKDAEEKIYRNYIAECVRMTAENTAKMVGGSYIKTAYADIIDPKPQDNRTGEEIADEIIKKCGLEVTKDESV